MNTPQLVARLSDPRLENEEAAVHTRDSHDTLLGEKGVVTPGAALKISVVVFRIYVEVGDLGKFTKDRLF